jgi:uncharacterized glyoxalase superfamily protein PhnB
MGNLKAVELKAFVPAKDYEVSKQFYKDIGFTMRSDGGGIAYFHCDSAAFLLQQFYVKESAENMMLSLLVEDVDAWWTKLSEAEIANRYGVLMTKVELQPWRMRDFVLVDPTGVMWRIQQNVD